MPRPNAAEVKGHCNSYGFLGALCAIATGVSWSLTKSKGEKCLSAVGGYDELQWYHMVGVVAGIVICVSAVFRIATFLSNMTDILLYVAAVCIAVCGGIVGYAAYYAFQRPCNSGKLFGVSLGLGDNIFEEKDGEMIAVFILDIIACIMFFSCAGNVARRAM